MSVGNIGRPSSPLAISSSQIPALTKAFKPLNARLAVSPGIGTKSPPMPVPTPKPGVMPVPIPRPSQPLPFSRPAQSNLRDLQSVIKTAGRIVDNIDRRVKPYAGTRRASKESNAEVLLRMKQSTPSGWRGVQADPPAHPSDYSREPGNPAGLSRVFDKSEAAEQQMDEAKAKLDAAREAFKKISQIIKDMMEAKAQMIRNMT